jgi:hypothetical protein
MRSAKESKLEALIRLLSAAMADIDPSDSIQGKAVGSQLNLTEIMSTVVVTVNVNNKGENDITLELPISVNELKEVMINYYGELDSFTVILIKNNSLLKNTRLLKKTI